MDAFGDLLRGVRSHGSVFGYARLSTPWSLDFVDGAPLTLCAVVDGVGWVVRDGVEPVRVTSGDTVVVRGPETFSFRDEVDTDAAPEACGVHCSTPELGGARHRQGWTDHGDASASTSIVVGAYPVHGEIGDRLLEVIPPVILIPADDEADAVTRYLATELQADRPGQQVVLDRLLDWLLVCSLRTWFDGHQHEAPQWYSAMHDDVVGPVLGIMHAEIDKPWTVAALAGRSGVSRAAFAKRFADLVGEPPLTYLTRWRMTVAADRLLERPDLTIADVAREVGYTDPFTFSSAFKRIKGSNPSTHRASRREEVARAEQSRASR
ncbi:AraC family transcriptional regulator [Gordonia sp. NPDC058843]|uniref:AraC family transcriptional regulator n=1 Tax=Gordonia sp. NPDC058843 TaxID=3346648 RepID=UPI0036AF707F